MDDMFRTYGDLDDIKDPNITPKGIQDQWRFTPSLMDPNSFAFTSFANQPPGYYTPTPGGVNTLYHNQAGDLHTPGMGMNTPLSLPHSAHNLPAGDSVDLHHYQAHHQLMHPQIFHNGNPFAQQQTFAPSQFLNREDSGYVDQSPHKSPPQNLDLGMPPPVHSQSMGSHSASGMPVPSMPMGEKWALDLDPGQRDANWDRFRYLVTLNAPTAMVKHADEIPVTYLNKGQAYTVTVIDSTPLPPGPGPIKYRTFIRISFEDEQQRSKPGACWQLWKEGRGTNEAHQRGGKLQAVEHVDPNQGGDDETRKSQVELESASFDGFCVTWTPNPATGQADCQIAVRFNFLSTDFSHSKGVKGIPVRLCAKTEMIMPGSDPELGDPEVCFCKVKLFRDHGAERKLSNDVAHIKKTIEKLKQQIAQAESGLGSFGKRKRTGSMAKVPTLAGRPGKIVKHKRTWSMDSDGETSGRLTAEEDLHMKLVTLQDMFSSQRPASVLYLRGEDEDDPDLFPVHLMGGDIAEIRPLTRQDTWESKNSAAETTPVTSIVSPVPSSSSNASFQRLSDRKAPATVQATSSSPDHLIAPEPLHSQQQLTITTDQPVRVPKKSSHGNSDGWIEAFGVDENYQAPPEPSTKPVARFYVLLRAGDQPQSEPFYRAIYLTQRTVSDFVNQITTKACVDPTRVTRITRQHPKGFLVTVDDDVIREIPEGQDMVIELSDLSFDQNIKNEFSSAAEDILVDSDFGIVEDATSNTLEMRLTF
ncbi:MAG: hypothetical protein Q9227_005074 [Pyrenula ochraceoflavens]